MKFAHIEYLIAMLLLIPVLILLFKNNQWRKSTSAVMQSASSKLLINFFPLKAVLKCMAFTCIVLAAADPLFSIGAHKVSNEGVDIIVALDISTSMLATDVQPSRLVRAKMLVNKIINQQDNNRLGLILFAGRAYLQMPLSIDKNAANMYVEGAGPSLAPQQGTNIADAVNLAIKAFDKAEKKYKVLVVITDGEDHEGADDEAVAAAKANGIIVHTIGVGTATPSQIPLGNGEYKMDQNGEKVLTAINEAMITNLASKGGGKAFFMNNMNDPVASVMTEINEMDKKQYTELKYSSNDHQFVPLLVAALILLIIDFILPTTTDKSKFVWLKKNNV